MAKQNLPKLDSRPRISVICTEREQSALWELKNAAAGERNLSWSDFILEHFGIRKVSDLPEKK